MHVDLVSECWFVTCGEPAAIEAIGRCGDVSDRDQTVPVALCARHASLLRDDVVVLSP
jgi:hypothetical protein